MSAGQGHKKQPQHTWVPSEVQQSQGGPLCRLDGEGGGGRWQGSGACGFRARAPQATHLNTHSFTSQGPCPPRRHRPQRLARSIPVSCTHNAMGLQSWRRVDRGLLRAVSARKTIIQPCPVACAPVFHKHQTKETISHDASSGLSPGI